MTTYITPSRELYNKVRAGFVMQGSSLTAWCRANDMQQQNARTCLIGSWDGPAAQLLRIRIVEDSGITVSEALAS